MYEIDIYLNKFYLWNKENIDAKYELMKIRNNYLSDFDYDKVMYTHKVLIKEAWYMSSAKEELKQAYYKFKKADEMLEEYQKFKTRAEKMTATMSDSTARTNRTSDKVGENAVKMADLKDKYNTLLLDAENEQVRIIQELNKVCEPYRTVLYKRYVQRQNFETIASEMYYSYITIIKMHGEALIKYERRNEKWQAFY